jgi:hypothetical protein
MDFARTIDQYQLNQIQFNPATQRNTLKILLCLGVRKIFHGGGAQEPTFTKKQQKSGRPGGESPPPDANGFVYYMAQKLAVFNPLKLVPYLLNTIITFLSQFALCIVKVKNKSNQKADKVLFEHECRLLFVG